LERPLDFLADFLGPLNVFLDGLGYLILTLLALLNKGHELLKAGAVGEGGLEGINPFLHIFLLGVFEALEMGGNFIGHILERNGKRVMAAVGVVTQVIGKQYVEFGLHVVIIHLV
jgi:hypothetical protein